MTSQERLAGGEVRMPLEAALAGECVAVACGPVGRTALRTLLTCPRFRSCLDGDTELLGGRGESIDENNEASGGVGSLLSGRLSAIALDSVEAVRDERARD